MFRRLFKKRTMDDLLKDIDMGADYVAKAMTNTGYLAEYSIESLKEVDRLIDENSIDGKPTPDGMLSKDLGRRMFSIGAYVGEVLRRNIGGDWWVDLNDFMVKVNVELRLENGSVVWPMQKVGKRLNNGPEDSLYHFGMWLIKDGS